MNNHALLEKSIVRLEAQLQNWRTLDTDLPPLLREAVAESVIRRFRVCYKSWKGWTLLLEGE